MAKPVRITNLQGKSQDVTPGKGYPATSPDGKRGYIVYNDKGEGKFTAYPTQPSAKPKPVTITNLQGKTQDVTPGKGYPTTSPDGKRGYIVYDNKGVGKFTAYPDKPSPAPASGSGGGGRSTPSPVPAAQTPARQPAPQSSPVAKYMAAAAAARKSGDPAQMAAVRDQGLAIWRDKYKDTLAKKVSPTGQQLGTGQSVMAKQADELRALRPVKTPEAPVNTSATTTAAPAPQPTVKTDTAVQRVQAAQKPIPSTTKPIDTTNLERSKVKGTSTGMIPASYEYDAYDLVLEYLLSEGHADTVEEAHYVMLQMDAEHIQNIVEGFPVTGTIKTDPAQKLRLQQDSSGRKYYVGPGGREMSPQDVNKVMSGQLMVKGGKKESKPTTQVAHFEPEGEVIDERLIDKLNPNNSVASKAQNTSPFSRPTTPLPSYTSPFAKPGSRDDSGKLTTYGAGGGAAAERAGKSRAEVMRQGAKNLENKKPVNQGPDFGR